MKHIPLIGILWVVGIVIIVIGLAIAIFTAAIVVPIILAGLLYIILRVQKEV